MPTPSAPTVPQDCYNARRNPLAYDDLREWIKALEKAGELKRIPEEVSPELEITEITDRVSKIGAAGKGNNDRQVRPRRPRPPLRKHQGPSRPQSPHQPVRHRTPHGHVARRRPPRRDSRPHQGPDEHQGPRRPLRQTQDAATTGALTTAFPKTVSAKEAPCKQVILKENFDLNQFPILKCWPHDGGRFITLPCVHTRDPKSGKRNIGMYRMQVFDGQTTGMHWQRQKVAAEHYRNASAPPQPPTPPKTTTAAVTAMAESAGGAVTIPDGPIGGLPQVAMGNLKGSRLEVAVAIGTDPATTFSAIVPAPPEVEEFMIAGFLRGKSLEIVQCETVDLEVPAHAEIILEGYVELGELRTEGPFGDHTGFYTMTDQYPVFHLTCITHRRDPIYAATIVGKPPMEDAWMGKAVERIFLPAMRMPIPEIVDINLPVEGVFHNLMLVSITSPTPARPAK